jgi:hypothetical protein
MTNINNTTTNPTPSITQNNVHDYPSCAQILKDMEKIFVLALEAGKFSVALRAKELIGKEMGLFLPPSKRPQVNMHHSNNGNLKETLETNIRENSTKDASLQTTPTSQTPTISKAENLTPTKSSKSNMNIKGAALAVLLTSTGTSVLCDNPPHAFDLTQATTSLSQVQNYLENYKDPYTDTMNSLHHS